MLNQENSIRSLAFAVCLIYEEKYSFTCTYSRKGNRVNLNLQHDEILNSIILAEEKGCIGSNESTISCGSLVRKKQQKSLKTSPIYQSNIQTKLSVTLLYVLHPIGY